jgi:2-alkyl-3-oxoalkanoate reductase
MSESSTKQFSAALIGAGYIAEYHIAALKRAGIPIVGVCDLNAARAQALATKFNLRTFGSLREVCDAGANVVHVLTPPDSHAAITLAALDLGRHVLVEKPLSIEPEDCAKIEEAATAKGLSVCVNHSLLFDPQVRKALNAAKSGKLGKIVSVDILRGSAFPPFGPGPLPPPYRSAGYPFRDIGVHTLYLLEAFLGDIENVTADWRSMGGDPNLAFDEWRAQVRCANGMGNVQITYNVRPMQSQIIIQGTRAVLRVDLFLMFQAWRKSMPLPKAAERVINAMTDSIKPLFDVPKGVLAFVTKRALPYHGLQDLVAEFYKTLSRGEPAPVTPAEAQRVVDWTERVARQADADYARKIAPLTLSDHAPVLVTGASGGVGGAIVDRLLSQGQRVRIMVRRPPAVVPENVEVALGDLGDADAVDRAVRGVDLVIHAGAAMKGAWLEHERATVAGTQNVIDSCLKHRVAKMVHISSMSVIDWAGQDGKTVDENSPLEPRAKERGNYTRAKLEAEQRVSRAARELGLPVVILRPGMIYGPKNPVLSGAVARKLGKRWLVLGNGKIRLPLIHIDDVVEAVMQASESPLRSGEIIQLVADRQPTQNEVLRAYAGPRARVIHLPRSIVFMLGGLSEIMLAPLKRPSPLSRYRLHSGLARLQYKSTQAATLLPQWNCQVDVLDPQAATQSGRPAPAENNPEEVLQKSA